VTPIAELTTLFGNPTSAKLKSRFSHATALRVNRPKATPHVTTQ
jgi:FkbM family methyltransferase